ncbi:transcription factor HES-1-B-like [Liolophura sinensis]|uniref:transcription factor HES-1-B-like n=1 Tax=Liolophura sinensis TaxID=3198878 RepID=UPI003158EE1E
MEDKVEHGHRRTNKPLMEKRRRARINMCLGELKNLVLLAMNKDNSQFSKLEKADILEMAVKYLRHVQNVSMATAAVESTVMAKYQMGYGECAREVMLCLGQNQHVDQELRNRISNHLTKCLFNVHTAQSQAMAMRNFPSLPVEHQPIGCTRVGAPAMGLRYPGPSPIRMNYESNVLPGVVKLEPNGQFEPQNLSLRYMTNTSTESVKTEPLPDQRDNNYVRKFAFNPAPVSTATKISSTSVVSGVRSSPVPFTPEKPTPFSSSQANGKCTGVKRRLSDDGNFSSGHCHSAAKMATNEQRPSPGCSTASNRPMDESVWRPW